MKKGLLSVLALFAVLAVFVPGIAQAQAKPTMSGTYTVTVDYSQSLGQMIAAGKYDMKDNQITAQQFPVAGSGRVTVAAQLLSLNRVANFKQVMAEMNRLNVRSATLPELLAFGAQHPEVQLKCPITALGSIATDSTGARMAVDIYNRKGKRGLGMLWRDFVWRRFCAFLVVPK